MRRRLGLPAGAVLLSALILLFQPAPVPAQGNEGATGYDRALFSGLEYRMAGPYRSGRVTAVEGVPQKPYTFYMGSTGGGVWRSTDAGESWVNLSDGFFGGGIGAVEVADAAPSVIYVGTGSACIRGNVSAGRGVWKSEDGGETWRFLGLPEAGQIGRIAVHPRDPDVVYVAALGHPFGTNDQRGVFRSRDGGQTWEKVLFVADSVGAVDLAMNPENPREIFAAMWRAERKPWTLISGSEDSGLFRTTDGGETWEEVEGGGFPGGVVGRIGVTVSPANPDRVWALVQHEPGGGVYRSDDGGETWTRTNADRKLRQRAFYYTHIYADPRDEHTVYALNTGMYRSVDDGRTFERVEVKHGDVHDLWVNPEDPDKMVVGNDGGAQASMSAGRNWTTMFNQPTAEFYRVTVDGEFPYRVYGGQQDNSTLSLPSRWKGGVKPEQHWYAVGGGESGHIAVDPRDRDETYATSQCCGDWLSYRNEETRFQREIVAYPQVQGGLAAKDMEYRFQWNNPVRLDPHNPDVLYHGAEVLLKSTDNGQSWTEISPDLTGDDPTQQGQPGGPIDHDVTGVEVYNTIFALEPSPHEQGTIWVGSDDGLVHITRDGGENWTEITPPGMPTDGTVNAIDISAHRPGKAYVTVYNYRMDDFTPYAFRTEDYGQSWTRVADGTRGVPSDHFLRVVREDPDREGLLYGGTEYGMYVSFDDGESWQPFQLDLPVVPITDIQVHHQDLVVATQGRSFWILDDLTPLHELSGEVADADVHLFRPDDAHRMAGLRQRGERWPENRPRGAFLHYYLSGEADAEVTLEILESDGDPVRRFTSDSAAVAEAAEEPGIGTLVEEAIPASPGGTHRVLWDLRYPGPRVVEDAIHRADADEGYRAPPGTYRVRLTVGEATRTETFRVVKDPRLEQEGVTDAHLQEQFELVTAVRDTLNRMYDAVRNIRSLRDQAESAVERAERAGEDVSGLRETADALAAELTAIEDTLLQRKYQASQDTWNYPPRLIDWMVTIYEHAAEPDARPTEGTYRAFRDKNAEWAEVRSRLQEVLEARVEEFNRRADRLELPALIPRSGAR